MDSKLKIFLEKIGLEEEYYPLFETATLKKIVVNRTQKEWIVFLTLKAYLPIEVYFLLEQKKHQLTEQEVTLCYEVDAQNLTPLIEGFPQVLECLSEVALKERYANALQEKDGLLCLIACNKVEALRLETMKAEIEEYYRSFGYHEEIPIVIQHEEQEVQEAIQKDLEITEEVLKKKEALPKTEATSPKTNYPRRRKQGTEEGCVLGSKINQNPFPISSLQGEDDHIVVDGYVFGVDYFESTKSEFRIITLKITDYTDSIFCKVFVRTKRSMQD